MTESSTDIGSMTVVCSEHNRLLLKSNIICFFFSSRRRHTILTCDWSSDVCSSDLRRYQAQGACAERGSGALRSLTVLLAAVRVIPSGEGLQRLPEEFHLPRKARAGIADSHVKSQGDSLGEGQTPVHPLRNQSGCFLAGKADRHFGALPTRRPASLPGTRSVPGRHASSSGRDK